MSRSLRSQHKKIADTLARLGFADRAARLRGLSIAAGRDVPAFNDLTLTEATAAIIRLGIMAGHLVQDGQPFHPLPEPKPPTERQIAARKAYRMRTEYRPGVRT